MESNSEFSKTWPAPVGLRQQKTTTWIWAVQKEHVLRSQAPYHWANGTDNLTRDSNPESPDYYYMYVVLRMGLEVTAFCSKDRCSAIEPLKLSQNATHHILNLFPVLRNCSENQSHPHIVSRIQYNLKNKRG